MKNDFQLSLEKFEKACLARKAERKNRIEFTKPYEVISDSLPSLKSPKEIFHSPWLFAQETDLDKVEIVDSEKKLLLEITPADQKYGGRVKIDDLAVLAALIGLVEDLVKNKKFDALNGKIEITAHALLVKMGLKSFSSKDYEEVEKALYRLRKTEYRGLLLGKNGWEEEFHLLDYFSPKREDYKGKNQLKKFRVVLGQNIALSIMQAPDKPLLQLGKGFVHLRGGFKKKLWYLIVGRIGQTEVWFSEKSLMKELECPEMEIKHFRQRVKRILKSMPWTFDEKELKEKSVYKFYHKPKSSQIEFEF